ncbi:hypothetical protein Taro_016234 [Colocasia esculenta]|uniref:Sugar phosphate transporter domain-containing protein n=1 Tax=Colocasia esculenta TaxID=4460 RepID=A0A843UVM6_COLES|nr:hypothetical protein [Colocasia esculenta]
MCCVGRRSTRMAEGGPLPHRNEAPSRPVGGARALGEWGLELPFAATEGAAVMGSSRPFAGSKSLHNDDTDLEDGKEEKDRDKSHKAVKAHNQALLSGLAYCLSSCSMILVNKFVLSSYNFNAGISLMVYQYINVAMVTVLKNVTNVITAVGETYLFKKYHGGKVWAALLLMIVSAVSGGLTDLSFHAVGYTWQTLNCFLTASYSLTLRRIMDTAKQVTKSGNLNEFSMVLLNNVLSLPLGILLLFLCDEVDYLSKTPLLNMPMFWVVITLSGLLGLAISFTSMWFLHQTGATTYSLVGSLNKIPLSVAGIVLFNVPTSLENLISILFGLLAGVFFAKAKMGERSKA